ncbi:MAG: acylphosphatase [Kiritimatiellaeota bacterium]|nr:acylphosphatase [Kiritimatiellota bacterium]
MDANHQNAPGTQRLAARFEGHVQGVGFRYTTVDLAGRAGITGYVSNLMDGDVELVAEGAGEQLREVLAEIQRSHLGRFIRRVHQQWSPATGEFADFSIR